MKPRPNPLPALVLLAMLHASWLMGQPFPKVDTSGRETMRGTFYSDRFVGRKTSSGEVFTQKKYTAAHRSYKFGTLLLVTNPKNGKQVIVKINDRCPRSNILDMTRKAASSIGVKSHPVEVLVLPESYLPVWESQEHFAEILEDGRILEFLQGDSASTLLAAKDALYDVELFVSPSREAAKNRLAHLPLYYRDKVDYRRKNGVKGFVVVLDLSLQHDKAEAVAKELEAMFPDAKAVVSE